MLQWLVAHCRQLVLEPGVGVYRPWESWMAQTDLEVRNDLWQCPENISRCGCMEEDNRGLSSQHNDGHDGGFTQHFQLF